MKNHGAIKTSTEVKTKQIVTNTTFNWYNIRNLIKRSIYLSIYLYIKVFWHNKLPKGAHWLSIILLNKVLAIFLYFYWWDSERQRYRDLKFTLIMKLQILREQRHALFVSQSIRSLFAENYVSLCLLSLQGKFLACNPHFSNLLVLLLLLWLLLLLKLNILDMKMWLWNKRETIIRSNLSINPCTCCFFFDKKTSIFFLPL